MSGDISKFEIGKIIKKLDMIILKGILLVFFHRMILTHLLIHKIIHKIMINKIIKISIFDFKYRSIRLTNVFQHVGGVFVSYLILLVKLVQKALLFKTMKK